MPKTLHASDAHVRAAHAAVSAWMHRRYGASDVDAKAFYTPTLRHDFDFTSEPTIALVLELGDDWAIEAAAELSDHLSTLGIFAEPYSAWALCLYRA